MGDLKTSICDPDTSDEESTAPKQTVQKYKKARKSAKSTSPKPMRVSIYTVFSCKDFVIVAK